VWVKSAPAVGKNALYPHCKEKNMSKRKIMYGSIFESANRIFLSLPFSFLENGADEKF